MDEPSDTQVEVRTVSRDGIVMRNIKAVNRHGQEVKTTEYFLDVQNQNAAVEDKIEEARFISAVEGDYEEEGHLVAVEIDNADGIVLDGKDVIIWDELCRICANTSDQFVPIFSGDGVEHDLYNKIRSYLPLKISEEDGLPQQVCYNCAATLLAWHDLVKNCDEAQQRLLELQSKINIKDQFYKESMTDDDNVGTILEVEADNNEEILFKNEDEEGEEILGIQDTNEDGQLNRCPGLGDDNNVIIVTALTGDMLEPLSSSSTSVAAAPKKPSPQVLAKRRAEVALAKCVVDGVTSYQCPECPKRLSTAYNFTAHRRVHAKERTSQCVSCNKYFSTSSSLTRHVREVHNKIKDYKCSYCDRRLATKVSRDEHQRTHTDERPHVCNVCGKAFRQRASLSVHKRFHSSTITFHCKLCDKTFRRKQDMQRHELTHTNLMPYGCSVCGKSFRSSASAIRHRQTHDDAKFMCDVCGECFGAERLMRAHKKRRHKDD